MLPKTKYPKGIVKINRVYSNGAIKDAFSWLRALAQQNWEPKEHIPINPNKVY